LKIHFAISVKSKQISALGDTDETIKEDKMLEPLIEETNKKAKIKRADEAFDSILTI
jgi:hypothetical protein